MHYVKFLSLELMLGLFCSFANAASLYATLDDAAVAAAKQIAAIPSASEQEFICLIYLGSDGRYGFTEFQTQGERGSSSYHGPIGGKIAGIVHNHPAPRTGDRYFADRFSARDVEVAIAFNVPSYIVLMPDYHADREIEIRRYIPRPSHKGMAKHGEEVALIRLDLPLTSDTKSSSR